MIGVVHISLTIVCYLGYYKNPEQTSASIDDDGWMHSGDLGYYDNDFDFFVVDRIKELIKYKGFQARITL